MKKKLFIIFAPALFIAVIALFVAASGTAARGPITLGANNSVYTFTPTSAQYLGGKLGKDTLTFEILSNKIGPVTAVCFVDVSSRKGSTDTYSYTLAGKHFLNESYTTINAQAAQVDDLLVADTLNASERDNNKYYRYFRMTLATDNNCAATDSIVFSAISFKVMEW